MVKCSTRVGNVIVLKDYTSFRSNDLYPDNLLYWNRSAGQNVSHQLMVKRKEPGP